MLHVLEHVVGGSRDCSDSRKKRSAPSPVKSARNGQPAAIEPSASSASGISITFGLSCAAS